jgi:hypothetical protein
MKNYKEILGEVRSKNPKLSFREAQITASNIFREQKEMAEKANAFKGPVQSIVSQSFPHAGAQVKSENKVDEPQFLGNVNINPDDVEQAIRDRGIDLNSIKFIAQSFSPYFTLHFAGKEGVNTLVYLDGPCRVPASGFFKIFYVKQ